MFWVLESNFFREQGYDALVSAIERMGLSLQIVKPVPMTGRLIPADVDASRGVEVDDTPEPVIDESQPIITMGSYTLSRIAKARGWTPGAFLENLAYDQWQWPRESLLNPVAKVCSFQDVDVPDDEYTFIRPVEDSKAFSGKVFKGSDFRAWQTVVLKMDPPPPTLDANTMVIVCPPVAIYTESRLFVVDGEIATYSGYKRGSRVVYSPNVDDEVLSFGRQCIAQWQPNAAFVLDIAQTPEGCKVVETNCLNSAGLYACDAVKLVAALEVLGDRLNVCVCGATYQDHRQGTTPTHQFVSSWHHRRSK